MIDLFAEQMVDIDIDLSPFKSILYSKVSEKQSAVCHRRLCDRIEDLLDRHIKNCGSALLDEDAARNKLKVWTSIFCFCGVLRFVCHRR